MRFWLIALLGAVVIAAVVAWQRRMRLRQASTDPWPEAIMGDLREFDTVRVRQLIGTAESHLAMSETKGIPAIGDEGIVLDYLQRPSDHDPQARIIVESCEWLAVFRREELEVVSRASQKPLAG